MPETDAGLEGADQVRDETVKGLGQPRSVGDVLAVCPPQEFAEAGAEFRFDLRPPVGAVRPVSCPGPVVDRHEPGDGEQRLPCKPSRQLGSFVSSLECEPPPLCMYGDVAVEAAGGTDVRGVVR